MLAASKLVANLRAPDLDAAVAFYEGRLGLPLEERRELMPGHGEVIFAVGGGSICIEQGEPVPNPGTPVALFVEDIEGTIAELRERGVTPEEYDLPHLKTVDGIVEVGPIRAAWLKDPAGNTIGLMSRAAVPAS